MPLLLFIRFSGYATAEILTNFFVGFLEELEPRQIAVDISDQLYIGQGLLDSKRSLHHRYAICFLFLRQVEKVLPNAKTLQNLIQNGESCIIDEWQCGYVTDLAKWGKSMKSGSNTKTPLGL